MAARLLLTGSIIDAQEALRIGLVSQVVAAADLLPEARALAGQIAANPPEAVQHIKEGLRRGAGMDRGGLPDLAAFVGNGLARLFESEGHREAVAAFTSRRT
jgi:enoyl-CoA hydratase/carnithine racemase